MSDLQSISPALGELRQRLEVALEARLPAPDSVPQRLHDAMRYACLSGGKRIRAMLTYAAGTTLQAPLAVLDVPACAIEMVHAYSLVHDDLPAMDNDELRRGRPTCHIAYDPATAILVGDALQALAFQLLAEDPRLEDAEPQRLKMIAMLARAAGSTGMVGGQAQDIDATGRQLSLERLQAVHNMKTGALISAAVGLGALAGNAGEIEQQALQRYGERLGLAFQIVDDVLDEEGNTATLGKSTGADRALGKATYPAVVGIAESRRMAEALYQEALAALAAFGEQAELLRALAQLVVRRHY